MALEFSYKRETFAMSVFQTAQNPSMQEVRLKVSLFNERGWELLSEEYSGKISKLSDICSYCSQKIFGENENCLNPEVNNFLLYHSPKKIAVKLSTVCPNCQMEQDEIILFPGDSFGNFFD